MILEVDESGHTNMSTSVYSHHFNNLIIKRWRGKWLQQIYNIGKITAVHRDKKGSICPALCLDKIFYLNLKRHCHPILLMTTSTLSCMHLVLVPPELVIISI